jgi:glycosyltransferase involved in cell wall biosynthesis
LGDLDYPLELRQHSGEAEAYFSEYSARDYRGGAETRHRFFNHVADTIVAELAPETVLDAGCGTGMLVAALRERGVDARGIDISEYALAQIPQKLQRFFSVASVTHDLDGTYDLIVCIEVLEHVPAELAPVAVENLCRHTNNVLFSSTPDDFRDPTHINAQPMDYWAGLFAHHGFFRNVDLDASFLAPHAINFTRSGQTAPQVAIEYERWYWRHAKELQALRSGKLEAQGQITAIRKELERERAELQRERLAARSTAIALRILRETRTFRYTAPARALYGRLRARAASHTPYHDWIAEFDTLTGRDRATIRDDIATWDHPPLISILMPVYNSPDVWLRRAIESVRRQLYEHWELCIADDASSAPHISRTLHYFQALDSRIKLSFRPERGNISAASNTALDLCTGQFIALLGQDDELSEHALYLVAREINEHPGALLIYSDEDKIDLKGRRFEPYFKPNWNPDLFRSKNCVDHLGVYRTAAVRELGGFRTGFEGSQDYDLALRVTEVASHEQIRHIPAILYHRRTLRGTASTRSSAERYASVAARRSLEDHLKRTGRTGRVLAVSDGVSSRVKYSLPDEPPLVSVLIPTRDGTMLRACVDSLRRRTTYANYEIVIVDNRSSDSDTLQYLRSLNENGAAHVLLYDEDYSHSAINNFAATYARGEMLCLLNDDIEIITPDWLEEMVSHAVRPEVGAVGAKLLYPDNRVQHGGIVLGVAGEGLAGHAHRYVPQDAPGYHGRAALVQNYSAVTGACLVVRREVYEQVGGLDEENLPDLYNDVDFGIRLGEAGYWNVWTPYAVLTHHESLTRQGLADVQREHARERTSASYLKERWAQKLLTDPAYNPNLTHDSEDFDLAWPPRVDWPWVRAER